MSRQCGEMRTWMTVVGTLWLVAAGGLACSPPVGGGGDASDDTGAFEDTRGADTRRNVDTAQSSNEIEDLTAVANPANALSYYVDWSTIDPAATELTVDCGDGWEQTYTDDGERTDHEVFVMGLWEGAVCTMAASAPDGAGEPTTETIAVDVGPLPDFLPEYEVHAREASSIQPGWTMFNLTNPYDGNPLTIAMVDNQGRYRWYHQLPTSNAGADPEIIVREESVFVGGNRGRIPSYQFDWEGNVLWEGDFPMHHDLRLSADEQFLWVLQNTSNCPSGYSAEKISKYSREEEAFVDEWPFCKHWELPESELEDDWSHVNTIEPFEGEEEWLMSGRDIHTIFKFDIADDEIDWKMGIHGDFGLADEDLFYRQHAPEIQDNGNILLFDNGASPDGPDGHDRPWSRALEISYDTETMEAEAVWSYKPDDPEIFAPIWGDADRLDNGNTLITFGLRSNDDSNNSHIIEVTDDKEKVWHLEAANKWGWYRSDRVVEPPAGYTIDAAE